MVYQKYSFRTVNAEAQPQDFVLPIRIVGVGRERLADVAYRWNNSRHGHRPIHVLQWTLSGEGLYSEGGESWPVRSGDLFVARWNRTFEYRYPGGGVPWEFLWWVVEGTLPDEVLDRWCEDSPVHPVAQNSRPVQIMENLLARLEQKASWDRFALATIGCEFLFSLLRQNAGASSFRSPVESEARDWVLKHLSTATSSAMASHFGYNGRYFSAYFQRHTGTKPQAFIRGQRIEMARVLLTSTNKSVATISEELGFTEDNYFSRTFKKVVGQAPLEYRVSHQDSVVYDEMVPTREGPATPMRPFAGRGAT